VRCGAAGWLAASSRACNKHTSCLASSRACNTHTHTHTHTHAHTHTHLRGSLPDAPLLLWSPRSRGTALAVTGKVPEEYAAPEPKAYQAAVSGRRLRVEAQAAHPTALARWCPRLRLACASGA
jgi:hypothetical protein